ncbi:helix-turn-helix domain-containing protein [Chloroflexota bacterium]
MEYREFCIKLKALRKRAGLSQRQLAIRAGIDFTYLNKLESGAKPPPSEKVIIRLSKAIGVDTHELITSAGKVPSDIIKTLQDLDNLEYIRSGKVKKITYNKMRGRTLATRIKELRKEARLSQRDLAKLIGVDATYISKLENSVILSPTTIIISKLANILNGNKEELLILAGRIPLDIVNILSKNKDVIHNIIQKQVNTKSLLADIINRGKEGTTMLTKFMPKKHFVRFAFALLMVFAVGTSLWFSSPPPAKALTVGFPSLPSGSLGSSHSFSVTIDIANYEHVPITSVDIEIYNVADPTKKITYTGLPLTTGETGSYSDDGGTVSVTATAPNWEYFSHAGYALWKGTGYSFGTSLGYGYQSGSGAAKITYSGTWTSPSSWPSGGYKIKVSINASGPSLTKTFVETSSSFTLSVTAADEGGGTDPGGGPPATPTPGKTYVSNVVNYLNKFIKDVTAESGDKKAKVSIKKGVKGTSSKGHKITQIVVGVPVRTPSAPANRTIVGTTYEITVNDNEGATFDYPITLTFTYDPDEIPEGLTPEDLVIAWYDEDTGEWVELETVVDPVNHTLTVEVTHLSIYAIFGKKAEVVTPPATPPEEPTEPTAPPTEPTTPTTPPTTPTTPTTPPTTPTTPTTPPTTPTAPEVPTEPAPSGVNIWMIVGIVVGVIIIGGVVWFVWRRRMA